MTEGGIAPMLLLLRGARQIVQVCDKHQLMLPGDEMSNLAILNSENEQGLSLAVDRDGKIAMVSDTTSVLEKYQLSVFERVLDVTGQVLVPGLVDAHTHPVWSGDRVHEFSLKLSGASYMQIHQEGGGIHFTVQQTRQASESELLRQLMFRLDKMMSHGTTLVECKSGYGLTTESELKMLRVIQQAKTISPIDIHMTFCGAHAVPRGMTSQQAARAVIEQMLPKIHQQVNQGKLDVQSVDVFCEKDVFDVEETRAILLAAKKMGFLLNFHAEELCCLHSAEMAADVRATAVSHLEFVSDEGIKALASAKCVCVVLPTTAHLLRLPAPPVRRMLEQGSAVALGSDFNPNAYCLSMPMVMYLACVSFAISPPEALAAATINAAASLGQSRTHGSLEIGKCGDILVLSAPSWEHLIYQFGESQHIISCVVKNGRVVINRSSSAEKSIASPTHQQELTKPQF